MPMLNELTLKVDTHGLRKLGMSDEMFGLLAHAILKGTEGDWLERVRRCVETIAGHPFPAHDRQETPSGGPI